MTATTKYNPLLPLAEDDSDEYWEDDAKQTTSLTADNHINAPEVLIRDVEKCSKTSKRRLKEFPSPFSRVKDQSNRVCTAPTAAVTLAFTILLFGAGFMIGFMLSNKPEIKMDNRDDLKLNKRKNNWRTKMTDWGTESCVRLVDVDQDGVLDIIIGLALGKDVTTMLTEADMDDFCRKNGMEMPCAGAIVALRGLDGKFLWKAPAYAEVFELVCHGIDINQDGVDDCLATGRLGEMRAINVLNGELLWTLDKRYLNRGWNIYAPAILPDVDDDGVADIVISHGGDPTVTAEDHNRRSGHIMMVSGKTGRNIGTYMKTPNERETYMSPVIHDRKDGSQYILIGMGGETVDGELVAVSIPDFYRYVKDLPSDHPVANTRGRYEQWGFKKPYANGTIPIFRSADKGVMVPPVLIDMNNDGVKDILVNAFNGYMVLYDGETLNRMWKIKFEDRESYSTPAPGYFNDDDVIDFMVHWSVGAWPFYNTTDTVIIDGRDGSILWNLTTNKYDVSSDLVARTAALNRDMFIFRAQGRNGHDIRNDGAIHGATGIQRIINKRVTPEGTWDAEEIELTEDDVDISGVLLPDSHFRTKRAVIDKDYIECESDQQVFLAELFALDRTVMKAPVKLWERGSEKYFYKLNSEDQKAVQKVIEQYGGNHTMTENEVPWSRGKRETEVSDSKDAYCILIQPDERTTGAIGDVDGDGKLDIIVNLVSVGVLRDNYARYVKMKFNVDIFKLSLEDVLRHEKYTPINVTIHEKMRWVDNENKITTLKFLPPSKQTWGGYMGTRGDSTYTV